MGYRPQSCPLLAGDLSAQSCKYHRVQNNPSNCADLFGSSNRLPRQIITDKNSDKPLHKLSPCLLPANLTSQHPIVPSNVRPRGATIIQLEDKFRDGYFEGDCCVRNSHA